MLKYFTSGLRLKLVLLTVAGVVTAFTVIGGFRVVAEKQRITDDMKRSGQERVAMIAEAVANLLVGYDYSNMESLAERMVQQQDVQHIIIRDKQNKVMVSRNRPSLPDQTTLSFEAPVLFNSETVGKVDLQISLGRMEAEIAKTYRDIVIEQVFFGLFIGLLIFFGTSRVIVKPVSQLSQHMKELLNSRDAATVKALELNSQDELGDLSRIFNSLNQKVFEAQQRLREKIDLAGTALMKTNEQLQQRSQELESRTQDLEKALSLVEKLAVTDSLTDLRNRRYFDDNLAAAFARSQRFGEPICLILLDVDHFKQINDTYGHAAGDTVLQTLGRAFKSRTRETDIVARLGGDEFAFLLYRTSLQEGELFGDNLLTLAAEQRFIFHGQEVRAGLSIGIACNQDSIHSIEALYGAADEALYEAKRRGRNRAISYPFAKTGADHAKKHP
ncbi:MAG: diguanylate cyclase [Candidatus Thermoplasmatota archaeon]|nr:diguanylate cyclase [Candidatus Thermoplasmatota archaeon]